MDSELKILIAVSNKLELDLTRGSLSFMGFSNIQSCHNASAAAEALLTEGADILISDHPNLKKGGANLLEVIKTHEKLAGMKTILIAAEEIDAKELKQLSLDGVHSVIRCPFQMNDLQKVLQDVVRIVPPDLTDTFTKIRQLDFFSFMDDREIVKLLKITKCRKYKKDEIIFEEGQLGELFYVIVEGNVSIFKVTGMKKPELLARLGKGACFGEMAILEHTTRSAGARADDDVLLFELDNRIMDGYDDTIMMKLFKKLAFVFSGRLRNADKKIQQLTKPS